MANPHLLTGLGAAASLFLSAAGACAASVPGGLFAQYATGDVWAFAAIIIGGVLAIYGLIIAVILVPDLSNDALTEAQAYKNLTAGLAVGLSCLASGMGMKEFVTRYMNEFRGTVSSSSNNNSNSGNDNELRDGLLTNRASKPLVPTWRFLFVLVFIEAIGLYGLIVALFMSSHK